MPSCSGGALGGGRTVEDFPPCFPPRSFSNSSIFDEKTLVVGGKDLVQDFEMDMATELRHNSCSLCLQYTHIYFAILLAQLSPDHLIICHPKPSTSVSGILA